MKKQPFCFTLFLLIGLLDAVDSNRATCKHPRREPPRRDRETRLAKRQVHPSRQRIWQT